MEDVKTPKDIQSKVVAFCKGIELLKAGLLGNLEMPEKKSQLLKMEDWLPQIGEDSLNALAGMHGLEHWREVDKAPSDIQETILEEARKKWYEVGMRKNEEPT